VRIVVIGGSGHVGSFLVPRLVRSGHEVINLTRGAHTPYATTKHGPMSSRSRWTGRPRMRPEHSGSASPHSRRMWSWT
jgi:nucleoside-diphosphate-sugar epimerase